MPSAPTEAASRRAALLQQIFEVDPLACPTCHGAMRLVAFITQPSVIDLILAHLRTRASAAGTDGESGYVRQARGGRRSSARGCLRPGCGRATAELHSASRELHETGEVALVGRPQRGEVRRA